MMKPPPPRRNYAQMVRVVRDDQSNPFSPQVPYQLGKAYAQPSSSGTDTRIRSLDELGINTRPVNQLQAPSLDANYNTRESTSLYHQISQDQQLYFDGVNPNPAPTRLDARPGTKTRTYLNSHAVSEKINVATGGHSTMQTKPMAGTATISGCSSSSTANSLFGATPSGNKAYSSALNSSSTPLESPLSNSSSVPKQTRLPFVKRHTLEGTSGTSLDFSLSF